MSDDIETDLATTLAALHAAMMRGLADRGFTDASLVDAQVLHQARETPSLGAIARTRGVTKQAVQGHVQSLLRRGYVTLSADPNDARAKRVELTPAGEGVVRALAEVSAELATAVEGKLGVERLKNMRNMLGQTRAALE
ncbi:MarR family protein [Litoreibacter ponti]|uniref:MarR family protein n=1 Tax=Litoreibacter ponti TaxID=1510457 RepID=A0A2T6BN32_9RHOB|nr:MarR family winged helix-turn-helix transcriptional regulator [Litoreibacter ponti]PTX57475.1 MarR family protein [Litoreibacter ponti]